MEYFAIFGKIILMGSPGNEYDWNHNDRNETRRLAGENSVLMKKS